MIRRLNQIGGPRAVSVFAKEVKMTHTISIRIFLALLLLTCLSSFILAQDRKEIEELKRLRTEFVKATKEYKASIEKLIALYEKNVERAENKVTISEKLLAEGLIARAQVDENKRALAEARDKLEHTKQEIAKADKQIAELPSDEELIKEYRRAQRQQQRTKTARRCANWDLVVRQRQTARSISFSYTFICR